MAAIVGGHASPSMVGVHLRLCTPPGVWPPWFTDVTPGEERGFNPAVMRWLAMREGFTVEYVPFDQTPFLTGQMSYAELSADLVRRGVCDLAIGFADVPDHYAATHESFNGTNSVVHTHHFVTTPFSMLVKRVQRAGTGWQLFDPFEFELWGAILGSWMAIALSVAVLEFLRGRSPKGFRAQALLAWRSIYYSATALLDGDSNEWVRWPSKLVHVGVLFFTLVILASYTASLTAFISQPTFYLAGPTKRVELANSVAVCAPQLPQLEILKGIMSFQGDTIGPPLDVARQGPIPAIQWCSDQLDAGTANAIFVVDSEAQAYLFNHGGCGRLAFPPALRSVARGSMNLLVGGHSGHDAFAVATNLSRALLSMEIAPEYHAMLEEYLLQGRICPYEEELSSDAASAPRLKVEHLTGLFIVTFTIIGVAVVGAMVECVVWGGRPGGDKKGGGRGGRGGKGVQHIGDKKPRAEEEEEEEEEDTGKQEQKDATGVPVELMGGIDGFASPGALDGVPAVSLRDAREHCHRLLALLESMDRAGGADGALHRQSSLNSLGALRVQQERLEVGV